MPSLLASAALKTSVAVISPGIPVLDASFVPGACASSLAQLRTKNAVANRFILICAPAGSEDLPYDQREGRSPSGS